MSFCPLGLKHTVEMSPVCPDLATWKLSKTYELRAEKGNMVVVMSSVGGWALKQRPVKGET